MGLDCIAQAMRNEDVAEESHVSREKTMQPTRERLYGFFSAVNYRREPIVRYTKIFKKAV